MIRINIAENIDEMVSKYGDAFKKGGEIQKFIDVIVMKDIEPYLPYDKGQLKRSGEVNTTIGDGEITWKTPYVKSLWHGKSSKGNDLKYNTSGHPLAGKMWAERYKADRLQNLRSKLIQEVKKI